VAQDGTPVLKSARARVGLALVAVLALAGCEREQILQGERFGARALLDDGTAGQVDVARALSLPTPQRVADWGQRGMNTENRLPHLALSAAPVEVWVSDIGTGNSRRQRITADPVAADGRVFTIDADSGLRAIALDSGAPLWSVNLTPDFDRGGGISGGGLAVSGNTVYATTAYGEIVALDAATGAVRWRQRLGASLGAPMINGNLIYVVADDSEAWSINADDGTLRWQIPVADAPSVLSGGASPAISGRYVILPFPTGEVQAVFPQTGVRVWGTFVNGGRLGAAYSAINDITADPVVVGNTIYIGNQSGRVVALNGRTGETRWTARDGAYSPVLPVGDSLFFISDRNELIRIDADTGARIWGAELPLYVRERERRRKAVFTHFGPILAGGHIVVASGDGAIRLFSPETGDLVGSMDIRGGAAALPIVVNDTLLVVSRDGRLHAYR
jgi:outer membrane protein assembly factor BamB